MANKPVRILLTGDRDEKESGFPTSLPDGSALEWNSFPVLSYERLSIEPMTVEQLACKPTEWVIFTSPRAVRFWIDTLLENGLTFPAETQVACIGDRTAQVAADAGLTPDFVPSQPGTEGFLEEFEPILARKPIKPSILLPMAEGGRVTLGNRLKSLGCELTRIALYRTEALDDIPERMTQEELEDYSLILFTSPSSVDAITTYFNISPDSKIAAIGDFTANHIERVGLGTRHVLPEGDFQRIAEVL